MMLAAPDWLRDRRERRNLQPAEIQDQTSALGHQVSARTLAMLEDGRLFLSSLPPRQAAALCRVLGITAAEWTSRSAAPQSTHLDREAP